MKPFTTIAAVFLALIALLHLTRLYSGWTVIVNDVNVPMWISLIGFFIAGGLSLMLFREAQK